MAKRGVDGDALVADARALIARHAKSGSSASAAGGTARK
jgi:hypothetical protein